MEKEGLNTGLKTNKMKNLKIFWLLSAMFLFSCTEKGPKEIAIGKDQCDNCKMTITEAKYATQLITEKGKTYKFDDIRCMDDYASSNPDQSSGSTTYVVDFPTGDFIKTQNASLIKGGSIKSPMGGNTQAYSDKSAANEAAEQSGAEIIQ